jgi:hypothetical protein
MFSLPDQDLSSGETRALADTPKLEIWVGNLANGERDGHCGRLPGSGVIPSTDGNRGDAADVTVRR